MAAPGWSWGRPSLGPWRETPVGGRFHGLTSTPFQRPTLPFANVDASYEKVVDPVAETHKVTFDDCLESTENQVVVVEDGQAVAKPADPTCEGYAFVGWFSDTELTQEWDFSTPVTEDMTLWAKWEKNADVVDPGEDVETPTAPSEDDSADATDETEDAVPNTGDATVAVSGIAAIGAALAGAGALLKRRR